MIPLDRLDNDLAGWLDEVLIRTGVLPPSAFEAAFTAIVRASAADPMDAWAAFYRNTLRGLTDGGGAPGGTVAQWAPVHRTAASLAVGTDVVELGCCFGFLSLRLADRGHRVTAVDLSSGTVALLRAMADHLGLPPVHTVAGDATAVPLADGCADTVYAVHLLEHLPPERGLQVLTEMLRLARRRVVVAVPFEDEPNPAWGHVRRFDLAALIELGVAGGVPFRVWEQDGGWLVLDR
ncbi:MAG TPA: mycofactocin oligosaccharide methyltransferase MftM [Pseudonocardia sp.]|jgi:SAM-dependent methyltransferase